MLRKYFAAVGGVRVQQVQVTKEKVLKLISLLIYDDLYIYFIIEVSVRNLMKYKFLFVPHGLP